MSGIPKLGTTRTHAGMEWASGVCRGLCHNTLETYLLLYISLLMMGNGLTLYKPKMTED
jgi:hypothetical protein